MKRHIAILAFGLVIAAGATFSQISQATPGLSSASPSSVLASQQSAPTQSSATTSGTSSKAPTVKGNAASGHGEGQDN